MAALTLTQGVARQLDYWTLVFLRTWKGGFISSFVAPLFYVVAMGVLLGGFIDVDPSRLEGATSYLAFVVPGLAATHAMQIAVSETTYPVMGALKWHKSYYGQMATPLEPRHLAAAHLAFTVVRIATAAAIFLAVLAPFGVYESWWGPLLAWVALVLVGTAFATLVYGFSARLRDEQGFGVIFRLGVIPLTLFSGAFFPITNLGEVLAWVARLTPLWHGVNLSRMLCLDVVDWPVALLNTAVLLAVVAVGWRWSITGLERRLADG